MEIALHSVTKVTIDEGQQLLQTGSYSTHLDLTHMEVVSGRLQEVTHRITLFSDAPVVVEQEAPDES